MFRLIVSLFFALLLIGCSTEQGGTPTDETVLEGTPGWLELHNLSLHRDVEMVAPSGLYIKGRIDDQNRFTPTSNIEGSAISEPPEEGFTPGWLELADQKFHAMHEAVAPKEPFVEGSMGEDGLFHPDKPYKIVGGPLE